MLCYTLPKSFTFVNLVVNCVTAALTAASLLCYSTSKSRGGAVSCLYLYPPHIKKLQTYTVALAGAVYASVSVAVFTLVDDFDEHELKREDFQERAVAHFLAHSLPFVGSIFLYTAYVFFTSRFFHLTVAEDNTLKTKQSSRTSHTNNWVDSTVITFAVILSLLLYSAAHDAHGLYSEHFQLDVGVASAASFCIAAICTTTYFTTVLKFADHNEQSREICP